jgi:hypothetical protein
MCVKAVRINPVFFRDEIISSGKPTAQPRLDDFKRTLAEHEV